MYPSYCEVMEASSEVAINLIKILSTHDDLILCTTYANKSRGFDNKHLSMVWHIDLKMTRHTRIGMKEQHNTRMDNPTLLRNCGTNNKILRYKHKNEYFLRGKYFATSRAFDKKAS